MTKFNIGDRVTYDNYLFPKSSIEYGVGTIIRISHTKYNDVKYEVRWDKKDPSDTIQNVNSLYGCDLKLYTQ